MLRSANAILGYSIHAKDGDLGKIKDLYVEEKKWCVRYMIVATGNWLSGREVLIARTCFGDTIDREAKKFGLTISKEKIKNAPDIDTKKPVSRQKEQELFAYYNWPIYWTGDEVDKWYLNFAMQKNLMQSRGKNTCVNLRSVKEITGYKIGAKDGDIGHVDDVIVDDGDWCVRHLVVDTGTWIPGRKVLVSVIWEADISWEDQEISLPMLTKEQIKDSPDYDPSTPINEEYEKRLYDYYGRAKIQSD
jgi:sporulation protein YlmC with PRC-barrel domain